MTTNELLKFGIEIIKNNEAIYCLKLLPFLPPLNNLDIPYEDRFKLSCFTIRRNTYSFAIKINDAIIC